MGKYVSASLMLAMAFLVAPGFSQIGGTGSIQGVISDPSGAVVPGASVTATSITTQVKTTRQTTGAGVYNISPLQPGEYSVTVISAGFQTLVQEHVVVDALAAVGLNPSAPTKPPGSPAAEPSTAARATATRHSCSGH